MRDYYHGRSDVLGLDGFPWRPVASDVLGYERGGSDVLGYECGGSDVLAPGGFRWGA